VAEHRHRRHVVSLALAQIGILPVRVLKAQRLLGAGRAPRA
jgi:hypothetical protein